MRVSCGEAPRRPLRSPVAPYAAQLRSGSIRPVLLAVGLIFSRNDVHDASIQKAPSLPDAFEVAFHDDRGLVPACDFVSA